MVATVKPVNINAIALARLFSGTSVAAIVASYRHKTPCANADTTLAISNTVKLVATAAIPLPIMKIIMMHINNVFRDILAVTDVNTGAPNATPKAYKETVKPAVVTETCKSSEIDGNKPTLINSVVPIPNALIASANKANILLRFV